jgi:hypothetical protein
VNHQIFERKLRFWVALEARLAEYLFIKNSTVLVG